MFYPLHAHSADGSILDSIMKVDEYAAQAKAYNVPAIALTEHGTLSTMYAFSDACHKYNVKPIFGMEAYICLMITERTKERYHLVLLAKNQEGLTNLIKLHNNAQLNGFYYKPRIDYEQIKKYGKGLIALTACIAGEVPQAILQNDPEHAIEVIELYKECFDEVYLELQPGVMQDQIDINDGLVALSDMTNTPLVATTDIHYLTANEYKTHDYHVKLGRKSKEVGLVYKDKYFYFMDEETLVDTFVFTNYIDEQIVREAIKNTEHIANNCNAVLETGIQMPIYKNLTQEQEENTLVTKCFVNLYRLYGHKKNIREYELRLNKELSVISQKGFCGYFLIVQDYINYAKTHGIPVGPGRGSVGGSLVAHLLGISEADPIKYNLLFERFLDIEREAIPDIDIDIDASKREELFNYALTTYGKENCALVSTLHYRKAKGAIRDAARVLGYSVATGDKLAKLIPDDIYTSDDKIADVAIKDALINNMNFKKEALKHPDIIKLAQQLEGLPSSASIHPAGVIISPRKLTDTVPLVRSNVDAMPATSLTLNDAEKLLVKFDFLSLATLNIIKKTESDINWTFNYQDDALLADEKTWNLISSENTIGLFQISSSTYKKRMPRLKPKTIEELAACLALVRGPCISAGTDETYMQIKEGKQVIKSIHPIYDEITKDTLGILVYQEQIMKICAAFGMKLSEAHYLVKAAAKKKADKIEAYRAQFIQLAKQHDCSKTTAIYIFNLIENSAKYSFNKSHAVSYALLCYASAYLKAHYPLQYMKNLLTNTYIRQEKERYSAIRKECTRLNIKFLPADINSSDYDFTIESDKIRIGLCAVKGIGEKAIERVMETRPFASIHQLIEELPNRAFNQKAMNVAIFAGLFDDLIEDEGITRYSLYKQYSEFKNKEVTQELSVSKDFKIKTNDTKKSLEKTIFGVNFIYNKNSTSEYTEPYVKVNNKNKESVNIPISAYMKIRNKLLSQKQSSSKERSNDLSSILDCR